MQFRFAHNNFNVRDLERSLKFYDEALGLKEVRRINAKDGSFTIVYLSDGSTPHQLELTWLRDWDKPYNLGDNEFHLALSVDDFGAAHHRHQQMGCICFEIRQWASILSLIRTATGSRSFRLKCDGKGDPIIESLS